MKIKNDQKKKMDIKGRWGEQRLIGKQDGKDKLFLREKASFLPLPVYGFHLPHSKTSLSKPGLAHIIFV